MNTLEMIKEVTTVETMFGDYSYELTDYETARKQFEPKLNPTTCYLGLRTVFEGNSLDLIDTVSDIGETDDWEFARSEYTYNSDNYWEFARPGYTYNSDDYLERDIVYVVYTSFELDCSICFVQVHIGVDARDGFTDFFAFKMDSTYDMAIYEELSAGGDGYELLDIEVDGKRYWVSIRGAFDCWVTLATESDEGDMQWLNELSIDLYSEEDAIESIREIVKTAEWE